ncbi:MAG: hypothetical protein HY744_14570 [Deltaproteobacteria bacterium]|nr:hypothetical protein [Deltaproteobacteria bacterium]
MAGALLLLATVAQAADPEAEAQGEFRLGRAAFKKGEYVTALAHFESSQRIFARPGTVLSIALCKIELGRLIEAQAGLETLRSAFEPTDERAGIVPAQLAALARDIPTLQIELAPGAPAGSEVALDGKALGAADLGRPVRVDPGPHVVAVRAPGHEGRRYELDLVRADRAALVVQPGAAGAAPGEQPGGPATKPTPGAVLPPERGPAGPLVASRARYWVGVAVGAFGLAGLSAGAVTGMRALNIKQELETTCPDRAACTPEGVERADEGQVLSVASTVAFGVGAAALVAGAVLLVTSGAQGPVADVALVVQPGAVGLGGRF